MKAIYKKEVSGFFRSMLGHLYIAFMLLVAGTFFTAFNLQGGIAEFGYVLGNTTVVLLVVIPVITMRTLGEEQRQKTDQLLFTAPVTVTGVVLGKFFAVVTVFALPLVVLLACPLILSQYGTVPLLQSYSCFVAFILMGAACVSIGMFVSSLTEHQILAAVGTFAVLLVSYLINGMRGLIGAAALNSLAGFMLLALAAGALLAVFTKSILPSAAFTAAVEAVLAVAYAAGPSRFEGLFPRFLECFSLFDRYYDFVDGAFDVTHLVYYLSVTGLFLFWTVQSVEKRRWN